VTTDPAALPVDHADRGRLPALELGVAATSVVVLWFPFGGGPGSDPVVEAVLVALVLCCATVRRRFPVAAATVSVVATGTAAVLGLTHDPMVVAAWTLYPAALRHGRRLVHPVVLALGVGALALLAVLDRPGGEAQLRYVLCGGYALVASWALGTAVRRQRELARGAAVERARSAVADERARIAREMHDVLSHTLGTLGVRAGVAAHLPALDEAELRGTLAEIEGRSRDALGQLRGLLAATGEAADAAPAPGLADLDGLVADIRRTGTACSLMTDVRSTLDPATQSTVFRVVQESLTNVVRHAPGASAGVTVVEDVHGGLHVEVVDDGPGRAPGIGAGTGHGLRGVQERARALAGTAWAGNRDGGGFRVSMTLPARTDEAAEAR
jgi:signal transduction histidine kinase